MRSFEKNLWGMGVEENDEGHMEELRHGKFSPLPEEIQRVRKEAVEQGRDPDLAEQQFRGKLNVATARLRAAQREEALESLERASKKHKPKKE